MILFISSAGLSACSTVPERAIPLTPVCITAGISAMVIPPMATIGRCISFSCIRWMIAVYPSSPNIGLRFFLVVELARKLHADGVHLGKKDMPIADARRILGAEYIIGGTANTFEDVLNTTKPVPTT